MAVGGALRAAIKAGNWVSAARESRRRARALADLNRRGGISNASLGPRGRSFLPDGGPFNDAYEGVDTRRGLDWGDTLISGEGRSPRGAWVEEFPEGAFSRYGSRTLYPSGRDFIARQPGLRMRPIEAPYEGVSVLRTPSMAAGDLDRLTAAGLPEDLSLYGDYYAPIPVSGFPTDFAVPRVFGGDSRGYSPFVTPFPNRPRYFFNDIPF